MPIQLSLICPVYKVAEYLPELMQSLLVGVNSEQVEIIFIDDCCPDQSIAICEQFIAQHQQQIQFHPVIIKLATNEGLACARNEGLKVAKGAYIGFIDSDDAIAADYWQILSPYVHKASNDIIEFTYQEFTTAFPEVTDTAVRELPASQLNPFYSDFFVWTRLYRNDLVKGLRFPAGMIYEDIFYNIHAFSKAQNIISLSPCLVYYRKRAGSATSCRTSSYSQLLLNLMSSVALTIDHFQSQACVVGQVARFSLKKCPKGFTIKQRQDRRLFFNQCNQINATFMPVFRQYNRKLSSALMFKLTQLVCFMGALS